MTPRFRLVVIASLFLAAGFLALAFGSGSGSGERPVSTTSDNRTTTTLASNPAGAVADPVAVCASSIPEDVVMLVRELRGQVICRPGASGQPGHVEASERRIVIEARPGLTPMHYADTAASLAHQLDLEGRSQLS
jgi:hypothetical protein